MTTNTLDRSFKMPESFPCMIHPLAFVRLHDGRLAVEARYFAPVWNMQWYDGAVEVALRIDGAERYFGGYIAFNGDRTMKQLVAEIERVTGTECAGYVMM